MAQAAQVYGGDEINALVFDPGSAWTRIGWSSEDGPSIAFSTNYATRDGQAQFGDDSTYLVRPNTEIRNPMQDSVVEDWDNATSLWKASLSYASPHRNTEYLSDAPVLMTEPFWNSKEAQKKSMEFFLGELQSPAFFIAKSPVLALFAAGRGTGIVIDAGAQTLSVTPVVDGICLYKPARRSRKAGNYLNEQIREHLDTDIVPAFEVKSKTAAAPGESPQFEKRTDLPKGITQSFRDFQVSSILEQFKESVVQVPETQYEPEASTKNYKPRLFEFPDGHQVQLSGERFAIGETLFHPPDAEPEEASGANNDEQSSMEVDGEEQSKKESETKDTKTTKETKTSRGKSGASAKHSAQYTEATFHEWSSRGVSDLVIECLKACDVDARANLANNIVVTGGTSLTQGFTERINQDLQREFPMLKIRIFASGNMVERRNGSWIGGSILASLGTFHQLWVSKQEYEEVGEEQLVHKRFR